MEEAAAGAAAEGALASLLDGTRRTSPCALRLPPAGLPLLRGLASWPYPLLCTLLKSRLLLLVAYARICTGGGDSRAFCLPDGGDAAAGAAGAAGQQAGSLGWGMAVAALGGEVAAPPVAAGAAAGFLPSSLLSREEADFAMPEP